MVPIETGFEWCPYCNQFEAVGSYWDKGEMGYLFFSFYCGNRWYWDKYWPNRKGFMLLDEAVLGKRKTESKGATARGEKACLITGTCLKILLPEKYGTGPKGWHKKPSTRAGRK